MNYLYTLKNKHLRWNRCNWHCNLQDMWPESSYIVNKFGIKNHWSSTHVEYFLGDYFLCLLCLSVYVCPCMFSGRLLWVKLMQPKYVHTVHTSICLYIRPEIILRYQWNLVCRYNVDKWCMTACHMTPASGQANDWKLEIHWLWTCMTYTVYNVRSQMTAALGHNV